MTRVKNKSVKRQRKQKKNKNLVFLRIGGKFRFM